LNFLPYKKININIKNKNHLNETLRFPFPFAFPPFCPTALLRSALLLLLALNQLHQLPLHLREHPGVAGPFEPQPDPGGRSLPEPVQNGPRSFLPGLRSDDGDAARDVKDARGRQIGRLDLFRK